jgi:Cu(I)/Ag(I) efflux system membrane fusion protein/cobalt-zinc-cadmium efflux system membrane fusion protein
MHPEVVETEPGDCPICNMSLVPLEREQGAGEHNHGAAAWVETLYTCPMHPEVVETQPGECPICNMALAPRERKRSGDGPARIEIDPVQVQNIGVVSQEARVGEIARVSRTVGILDFDAARVTWVNTKFGGWIERVHVNYVGQEVRSGEPLFEIYSPELVATQEEYVRALEYRDSLTGNGREEVLRQAESLVRSSRERLEYWDISEEQIRELEAGSVRRRLTVRSPAEGIVAEVAEQSLEGMSVEPGMNLYKIADLSNLWLHAEIYESDLAWIREGQRASASFRADPSRTFKGEVLFLYPQVSAESRTLKICISLPNPDLRLRPGMYADVVVHGPPVRGAVIVPASAVLHSGERDLVFIDLGRGRFEPREIVPGVRGEGDRLQVLRGVAPGEAVVTQAQFMLDSESRLREAVAKFEERSGARTGGDGAAPGGQAHGSRLP